MTIFCYASASELVEKFENCISSGIIIARAEGKKLHKINLQL